MNRIVKFLLAFIIFPVLVNFCYAEIPEVQPHHSWDLGTEIYHFEYEEPGLMKDKGLFYGLNTSYQYYNNYRLYRIEGRIATGKVDYESQGTGTMDNVGDYVLELRGLIGYDFINPSFNSRQDLSCIPFIGVGYRYLNDDSSDMITSTGAVGYERESNYIYSPVGIEVTRYFGSDTNSWSIGATAEFDIFWWGRQKSNLSDAGLGYADLRNKQASGYGLRGSLKLTKKSEGFDFVLEPFIRYWHIDRSNVNEVFKVGTIWGYGWEPKNETTEIGVKLAIKF